MKKLYTNGGHLVCSALILIASLCALLIPAEGAAQTNPAAQTLPYSQDFSSLTGNTTTFPAGIQGWTITGSTSTSYPTAAPAGDQALGVASNSSTSAFVADMTGKIGFLSTGSALKAISLALNTSGSTAISVSYLAATQRQETGARIGMIGLQYRIGNTGVFTNVGGSDYQNPGGTTNTNGTQSLNPQTISVSLPAACDNQPLVQLRWVYHEVSGAGNRPGFSIDNISVSGTSTTAGSITVDATGLDIFKTMAGTASPSQTVMVSGSNLTTDLTITPIPQFEISLDGGTTYSTSALTISPSAGTITNIPVTIRVAATASGGPYTGNISFTAGAVTQQLSVQADVQSTGMFGILTVDQSAITAFTTMSPAASATQSFTVSGTNISNGGISLFPGGDYFEISADGGASFVAYAGGHGINLPAIAGVVSTRTILVRIAANAPVGTATGVVLIEATSADHQIVQLSGIVNPAVTAHVVINQVYGGGGNSGATFKNDFVELYNNENTPVDLSGWSLQYAGATGTGTFTVHALTGTIQPHNFFLVQEAAGTGGTVNLPAPDAIGTLSLSGSSGKVILSNSVAQLSGANPTDPSIMDKVGYGSANGFETNPTQATDNTTSVTRITDGADTDNNSTDFALTAPVPRNSPYKTTAPAIVTLTPANGSAGIPHTIPLSISFDKKIVKGTGTITVYENGVAGTPLDVNDAGVVISNNTNVAIPAVLTGGKSYYVLVSAGAFKDLYNNGFAGIASPGGWAFTTYNDAAATTLPVNYDFQNCTGNGLLPGGFTQYNTTGAQVWDCTSFGRDPSAPAGTAAFPNAVQINGYANGVNNINKDWLISPKLDLTGTTYPLLYFWSRSAFSGAPLELKISTDYTGSGDPALATWTDLNGKFPSTASDTWTLSENINLSAYKQGSVYLAFVYTSTTDDGSRWTVDDISLINSATAPAPSLTVGSTNMEFGYTPTTGSSVKTLIVTGNDLTGDITLTATGNFQVSADGTNFASSATITQAVANNVPQTVYVRFSPLTSNVQFNETLNVSISGSSAVVALKGNSIDPASTLNVVDWNMAWFATPDPTPGFGPANKSLQQDNAAIVLKSIPADLFVLQEVVNEHALDSIVATMPGFAYKINNYGSYSNPTLHNPTDLKFIQKLAFVYKTSKFSNIHTDSLLTLGIANAADTSTTYYNAFASGRFPYMLSADVTLSDNSGGFITHPMRFINLHAKANTNPVLTAYDRRVTGAKGLDLLIKTNYINDYVLVLGDINDDLNQTITTGVTPPRSSYYPFTEDDAALYIFPTKPLSPAGQHSDVNFTGSVIDNVIATATTSKFYLPGSATVLSDVANLVSKYGTTTSDHYPVFTQFSFSTAAALPVKLTSFTASRQNNLINVNWSTSQEENSMSFDVERSADGMTFTKIGTVAAKGSSSTKTDYRLEDRQPLVGVNYYRLKETDLDGKTQYSSVVKVNFEHSAGFRITPNPASSFIYVSLSNINTATTLQVIDLNGSVIKQQLIGQNTTNTVISLGGLAKGLYTIKLVSAATVTTQKLVIQ